MPTISFVIDGQSNDAIVREIYKKGISIRFGDFYSFGLVDRLNLSSGDGVILVSAVNQNTAEQMDRPIATLKELRT